MMTSGGRDLDATSPHPSNVLASCPAFHTSDCYRLQGVERLGTRLTMCLCMGILMKEAPMWKSISKCMY